jgi:hypothetical protein
VRHIHVEINVADMHDCRGNVEMEIRIFRTLAKAEIPMDASALMQGQLLVRHGKLDFTYYACSEKWVFDWTGEL